MCCYVLLCACSRVLILFCVRVRVHYYYYYYYYLYRNIVQYYIGICRVIEIIQKYSKLK